VYETSKWCSGCGGDPALVARFDKKRSERSAAAAKFGLRLQAALCLSLELQSSYFVNLVHHPSQIGPIPCLQDGTSCAYKRRTYPLCFSSTPGPAKAMSSI